MIYICFIKGQHKLLNLISSVCKDVHFTDNNKGHPVEVK